MTDAEQINAERLRAVNAERERDELRARCASLISSNTTLRRERNEARAALESEKTTRNEIIAKGEILERLNAELESERGHLLSLVKDWNANFANAVKENEELRFLNQGWRRKIDKLCDEIDALRVANAELVAALRKLVKVGSDAYRAHLRSSTTMHAQLVFLSEVCDDAEEVLAREEAQA